MKGKFLKIIYFAKMGSLKRVGSGDDIKAWVLIEVHEHLMSSVPLIYLLIFFFDIGLVGSQQHQKSVAQGRGMDVRKLTLLIIF